MFKMKRKKKNLGLEMNEPMTLRQIAKELGISHQAVMEILLKAYSKVRKKLNEKGIKQEDLL